MCIRFTFLKKTSKTNVSIKSSSWQDACLDPTDIASRLEITYRQTAHIGILLSPLKKKKQEKQIRLAFERTQKLKQTRFQDSEFWHTGLRS